VGVTRPIVPGLSVNHVAIRTVRDDLSGALEGRDRELRDHPAVRVRTIVVPFIAVYHRFASGPAVMKRGACRTGISVMSPTAARAVGATTEQDERQHGREPRRRAAPTSSCFWPDRLSNDAHPTEGRDPAVMQGELRAEHDPSLSQREYVSRESSKERPRGLSAT
jgi:hypothetical protein